ncbi:MAG TPA: tetratricopeptide repeat protein [Burkholderiales bacterium]|nr:tetratricopeptide repeat protein [Burkholderiales bacterium]
MTRYLAITLLLVAGALLAIPAAQAAGDDSRPAAGVPADPDVETGKAAIRGKDWNGAISAFGKVANKDPQDADAQNWLGYAYRMSGKLDLALTHYSEALKLDPRHRGAHEYIGEAYLMKGDVAKAKEHLAQLDRLCFFGCDELSELKKAIAEYEKKGK